ncbi:MAG: hypothetical protein IIZ63_10505 [Caulobacteraceae bacterium]|nr:hypothetical protein [Caulobacteraceae bacterium]
MAPDRRKLLGAALALALALGLAAAAAPALAARPPVDVAKVFPFLDHFLRIPPEQRTAYELVYYLSVDGRPATGVHIWVETPQGRVHLPIGADGRVQTLPTLPMIKAHRKLVLDAPAKAKFGMNMELQAKIAPAPEIGAAEVARAIEQANAGIKASGPLLGLMAPKMSRAVFFGAGSGVAVLADGRNVALPTAEGQPAFNPSVIRGARSLRFTHPPSRILLAPAK